VAYVVGNELDLARRVPKGREVFGLAEMVLGDAAARFRKRLRELVKEEVGDGPKGVFEEVALPAILRLRPPLAEPAVARPSSTGGAPLAQRGTRWNEIELYFIDGDTLSVRVAGGHPQRKTCRELGMADKRGGGHTKRWELLVKLCEGRGHLKWDGTPRKWGALRELVSQLRDSLQREFGINGDPLELSKADGLRAAFAAFPYAPGARSISEADTDVG
jgi:hypothetical protein